MIPSWISCNPIDLGAATQTVEVDSRTTAVGAELSGTLSDGGLIKTGDGALFLSGTANSYSGGTYVEQGTLCVNNSGAIQAGSSLTIGAGGTFIFDPTAGGRHWRILRLPAHCARPRAGNLVLLSVAGIVAIAVFRQRLLAFFRRRGG